MLELLWLLLPVAAASGWYAATRGSGRPPAQAGSSPSLGPDTLKGLNYLLNEQPDRAIEVFTRLLEVDSETVETHLALGNLFRRRGEVDRAIRIHQNLIARTQLSPAIRNEALLELGQDYMRAGLLDRAEDLFRELACNEEQAEPALRNLTEIYQQEKDWDQAVDAAHRLEDRTGRPHGHVIAHYLCQQAEEHERAGQREAALELVRRALDAGSQCVRASLLEGRLLQEAGDYRGALRAYRRVERQEPGLIAEAIQPLEGCYAALGRSREMAEYLGYLMERYGGVSVTLALAEHTREAEGDAAAIGFLTEQLHRRPSVRGLSRLIEMSLAHVDGPARAYLSVFKDLTDKLLQERPAYSCGACGFAGRSLHWQCPSCKRWGTVVPIQGVEGE